MCCKKNWNLIRRLTHRSPQTAHCKPLTAFCLLLFACCLSSCDKEDLLYGRWNLQGVSINGKTVENPEEYYLRLLYTNYIFGLSNTLTISTVANIDENPQILTSPDGLYLYNYKKSTLDLKFTLLYTRTSIEAKVKKLNNKEMKLEYTKDGNLYLLQLYAR